MNTATASSYAAPTSPGTKKQTEQHHHTSPKRMRQPWSNSHWTNTNLNSNKPHNASSSTKPHDFGRPKSKAFGAAYVGAYKHTTSSLSHHKAKYDSYPSATT